MNLPNTTQSLLESFSHHLLESGLSKVSIKNYLSDLRHFFNFLYSLEVNDLNDIYLNISKYTKQYQSSQTEIFTPTNTINRRLASIRRFTTFLKLRHFHQSLPDFEEIEQNISTIKSSAIDKGGLTPNSTQAITSQKIIDQFKKYLNSEKKTHSTVKNYTSDIYHYFSWTDKNTPFTTHHLDQILSQNQLSAYVSYLKINQTTSSVINRRQSSIKKLASFCKSRGYINQNPFEYVLQSLKISPFSWLTRLVSKPKKPPNAPKSRFAKAYYKYHQLPFTPYLHLAILVLATTTIGILAYNQIIKNASQSSAATSLTRPKRQLSFQGRLSDSAGTPIVTTVNVNFKLWDDPSAGTQLYSSGTCSVTPDNQGIFNTLIGDGTCGSEISASVFSDNQDIYLEVGVGAETLTPRQQIATVGYALNSETLQGYPAANPATINSVPVIDNNGDINISVASPSIISTSGNFTLTGEALSLTTETGSGGDIILQPDAIGAGQILAIGSTLTEDTFRITNANLTTGSLLSGYIGNDIATGSGNLLQLSSGSTEVVKFRVTADGRTTISASESANTAALTVDQLGTGDIFTASTSGVTSFNIDNTGSINNISGVAHSIADNSGDLTLTSNSSSIVLNDNVTFNGTTTLNGQTYIWPASGGSNTYVLQTNGSGTLSWVAQSGGTTFWGQANGTLYPLNSTVDFLLGGQATSSAKFAVINLDSGTPTATIAGTTANTTLFYDGNGNIATTNRQSLVLGNSSTYDSTGNILLNPNGTGKIAIGTTLPGNLLTLGAYDAATSNSLKQGLFSTDNNLLAQLEGGMYFGRVGLTENQWGLSGYGDSWVAKDSVRDWYDVAMSSDGKIQTAVVYGGQIYISTDYGNTWTAKDSNRDWLGVDISSDGKIQTAGVYGGQIYVSTDYGDTWTPKDSSRNWYNVAISADGKIQNVTVDSGQIYVSTDYGDTWTAKDSSRVWYGGVAMSSDGKIQTAGDVAGQIYVSTDYGDTWTAKDSSRVWNGIAMSSDGKIQTAIVYGGQIYVSTDYGDTWTAKDSSRNWQGVTMSSDGEIQTAGVSGGQIYVSTDYGDTWTAKDSSRNWWAFAMSSDGKIQTSVVGGGQIYVSTAHSYVASGNVGIGDSTPNSLFTVGNGDLFQINSSGIISNIDGVAHIIDDVSGDLTLTSNSTNISLNDDVTFVGNANLTAASNLIFAGTTSLAETTAANDSGAYLVGVFDEFANSSSTNVQDVLDDLDAAITSNTGLWNETNGAIYPKNSTVDFFVGGTATTSAKFAILNIDSGTPVASVSSGLSGTSSFLTADGILGTENFQTLTVGNSTTGNILLGAGSKGISVNSDTWDVSNAGVFSGLTGLSSSGTITFSGLSASSAVYTDGSSNLTSIAPTTGILGFWQRTSGALAPWFVSDSINVGGTATSSALVHLGGTADEGSFFMDPVAIGFNTAITNPGIGGGTTALQVDGDILPGIDDDAYLGRASTAWSRLYLSNGINNSAGTEQISITNRNLTGGQWNATSTFRVGDSTKSMPTGVEFYVVGDASVSATFTAGANSRIIGDLALDGNATIGGGTGKIDVGTVDPPYTINGEKYATYLSGMIGVKEEVTGSITTDEYIPNLGYRKTIQFNNQQKGSDLWLFSKTTNIKENLKNISVLLTPNSQAKTWYDTDLSKNILYIYSSSPASISYRFTAPRFDSQEWQNTRNSAIAGFVLNDPDNYQNTNLAQTNYSNEIKYLDGQYKLFINNQEKKDISNFSDSVIANLITGLATVRELVADNLTIKTKLISPLADIEKLNVIDATISGTLTANNIKSKTIDRLNEQLGLLDDKYSTASAILANIQEKINNIEISLPNDPLQLSSLSTQSASLPDEIADNIINTDSIYTTDILASGSIFTPSLSSFDTDLFIQPTGDKPVHILANLLNLYPSGQVVVSGDLLVTGNIFANNLDSRTATISGKLTIGQTNNLASDSGKILALFDNQGSEIGSVDASGSANFNTLQTSGLIIASQNVSNSTISGTITSNTTIGTASIATGSSEIFIQNNLVNDGTLVYVTPISDTDNQVLYVKSKQTNSGFTIAVPNQVASQTSFNYWLVQTK